MTTEELKTKIESLKKKYQQKVDDDFEEQKEILDFFSNPKFGVNIFMTIKGDYAVIIFTINDENRESTGFSDPGIVDFNVDRKVYGYKKTGEYIATLKVNHNNLQAIDSNEMIDSLIDYRLSLLEKSKIIKERKSVTFLLRENELEETLGYLGSAEEHLVKQTPQGYSDCKNNCRKALDSMLETLVGSKDFNDISWIGGKEKEVFKKIQSLNAKHGSHTPTAQKTDAALALSLTKNIIRFVLEKQN